jgi:hypothetical protein
MTELNSLRKGEIKPSNDTDLSQAEYDWNRGRILPRKGVNRPRDGMGLAQSKCDYKRGRIWKRLGVIP